MAVIVLADSLAFHGPQRAEPLDDPRLWPNVMAAELGTGVEVFARQGWTARDAWWALTREPRLWSQIPAAEAVLLATGGMDQLPTAVPTYLRQGIAHLPTHRLREAARCAYKVLDPALIAVTGGPLRHLGARQTAEYHTRVVEALRAVRPELPVAGVLVHRWTPSRYYPRTGNHAPARAATVAWAAQHAVPLADWLPVIEAINPGDLNRDGMHLGWAGHAAVGRAVAQTLAPLLARPRPLPSAG